MRRDVTVPPRIGAVVAASGLSTAVGACGSSATTSSPNAAAAPVPRNADAIERARVKASSCMRAQGINIPDAGVGGGQVLQVLRIIATDPQVKVQAAIQPNLPTYLNVLSSLDVNSPAFKAAAVTCRSQALKAVGQ